MRRASDLFQAVVRRVRGPAVSLPQAPHVVLDHDHRAIDNHAEIHRTETHQVGGDAEQFHPEEREQQRQRNDRRHDDRAAYAAQEQEQHENHQQPALEQVVAHGSNRAVDHFRLIVEGNDADALGQRLFHLLERLLDTLDHRLAVLSLEHDNHARNALAQAVARGGALPRHVADTDVRHVAQVDRRAPMRVEQDRFDFPFVLHAAEAAHRVLLGGMLNETGAEVIVVVADTLENVAQRQAAALQAIRVDHDFVLLGEATPGVDVGDAGDGAQLVLDLPVVERLQLHGAVAVALDRVLVDLAERGGDRPHGGLQSLGNAVAGLDQAFTDELPGEVGRDAVFEDNRDHREPELRDRAHLQGVGQTHQRRLDGEGDKLLDLDGRQSRRVAQDRDLIVGEVGEGVDGEVPHRPQTRGDQHQQPEQHDPGMIEMEVDDALQHEDRAAARALVRSRYLMWCKPPGLPRTDSSVLRSTSDCSVTCHPESRRIETRQGWSLTPQRAPTPLRNFKRSTT